jgi:hypothetical protein
LPSELLKEKEKAVAPVKAHFIGTRKAHLRSTFSPAAKMPKRRNALEKALHGVPSSSRRTNGSTT